MEGITLFAAATVRGACSREIMDGGPHVDELVREHLGPLAAGASGRLEHGAGDLPAGGPDARPRPRRRITLYYFRCCCCSNGVEPRPVTRDARRARAAVRDCSLYGLLQPLPRGRRHRDNSIRFAVPVDGTFLALAAGVASAQPTRSSPLGVAPDGHVFVVNPDSNTVARLEFDAMHQGTLTHEQAVGRYPRTLAVAGGFVFTADQSSDTVSRVAQADLGGLQQVNLGFGCNPYGVARPSGRGDRVTCQGTSEAVARPRPGVVARISCRGRPLAPSPSPRTARPPTSRTTSRRSPASTRTSASSTWGRNRSRRCSTSRPTR
jgi:hypothetical protein